VVLVSYQPALRGGMLWDDDQHVITTSPLRSAEGLRRIWLEVGATQQFYPVVYTAFWLQHRLWGDDTLGYHLVNVVLHVCSAFLLVLILRRLSVPGAWLAAALFALHPVYVESVAWIAELKNTLSGVFYLAAMLAYLRFDVARRKSAYTLAAAFFVLALLSKTVTATLPLALLVVFWWQRGRLDWRRDVLPLAPFVVVGVAGGLTTAWIERGLLGARGAEFQFTVVERCLVAGRAIWFYLAKLAWPADLIFIYPRWHVSQGVWWQYLFPAGAAALAAVAWLVRKRSRAPLAALLLFCGTLFPVLGFLNVYPFRFSFVADHFQYLASVAIIVLFSATVVTLAARWHVRPASTAGIAAIVLGSLLAPLTWAQSRQYVDAETLYRTILRANPSCWLAHINLGILLVDDGRPDEAETNFREALRLRADLPEGHYNLGIIFHRRGQLDEAQRQYTEALRLLPAFGEAHNNLGDVLRQTGRPADAVREGEAAVRLTPNLAEAHYSLGRSLQAMGRLAEATVQFREAVRLGLDGAELRYQFATALHQMNRVEEAATQYTEALRLRPAYPEAHVNLGEALQKMGRSDEALAHYQDALRLKPDYADAYYYLGNVLQSMGRLQEAIAQYAAALRINPRDGAVHNNLGLALEGLGRFGEAAAEYRAALQLRPDLAETRRNLARVLAVRNPGAGTTRDKQDPHE
jgi:tetratricopeptide (TPR) repeat protein